MTALSDLVRDRRVIVTVGSGGVGKTTTSAVMALHAAIEGRKALVMTIDPARRLANSLGVPDLDHELRRIDLEPFRALGLEPRGEMWATMLDMKKAFDEIVTRNAPDAAARDRILNNRFYRFFSTSLAGAQELSATERLFDLHGQGGWDLIVLDTPPTTNALDFLDAPTRFFEMLDSSAAQLFVEIGSLMARGGGGILNVGNRFIANTLGRFVGVEFLQELAEFLSSFSVLFDGIRERSRATNELFRNSGTSFVVVTSPEPTTVDEAMFFRDKLRTLDIGLGAMVVNRVHKTLVLGELGDASPNTLADRLEKIPGADLVTRPILLRIARKLLANAEEFDQLAERDRNTLSRLREILDRATALVPVPLYATDIHSLQGLDRVRRDLFGLPPLPDSVVRALDRQRA